MILSAQTLDRIRPITPWLPRTVQNGKTFGLSAAGYDVRVREAIKLRPGDFALMSTFEIFDMPTHILAEVKDKSSWARCGLSVFNTVIEPGWRGTLTLELKNQGHETLLVLPRDPIAQIIFYALDEPTVLPYAGKYQDQPPRPVASIHEVSA